MSNEEVVMKVEQDIIAYLDTIRIKKGLTNEKWGTEAFQDSLNGRRKIQNFKKPQANGRVQQLRVADLIRLCKPLGIDPAKVLTKAMLDNDL